MTITIVQFFQNSIFSVFHSKAFSSLCDFCKVSLACLLNFSFLLKLIPKLFPQAELLINAAHVLMLSSAFLRKMLHLLQIDLF